MEIRTKTGKTIGFWWWSPVASTTSVIYECHVCVAPEYQKRWLTKTVRSALVAAVEEMKADYCLAIHPEPTIAAMLCRFGFMPYGMVHILDVKEITDG